MRSFPVCSCLSSCSPPSPPASSLSSSAPSCPPSPAPSRSAPPSSASSPPPPRPRCSPSPWWTASPPHRPARRGGAPARGHPPLCPRPGLLWLLARLSAAVWRGARPAGNVLTPRRHPALRRRLVGVVHLHQRLRRRHLRDRRGLPECALPRRRGGAGGVRRLPGGLWALGTLSVLGIGCLAMGARRSPAVDEGVIEQGSRPDRGLRMRGIVSAPSSYRFPSVPCTVTLAD